LRSGNVTEFRNARSILVKLDGVEVVEDRVVHVEGGERNFPSCSAEQKFLFTSGDFGAPDDMNDEDGV